MRSLARAQASAGVVGVSRPFWAICGGALQLQVSPNSRQPMESGKKGLCGRTRSLWTFKRASRVVDSGHQGSKGKQAEDRFATTHGLREGGTTGGRQKTRLLGARGATGHPIRMRRACLKLQETIRGWPGFRGLACGALAGDSDSASRPLMRTGCAVMPQRVAANGSDGGEMSGSRVSSGQLQQAPKQLVSCSKQAAICVSGTRQPNRARSWQTGSSRELSDDPLPIGGSDQPPVNDTITRTRPPDTLVNHREISCCGFSID